MGTNIAELRVYIREKPTDEVCRAEACEGVGLGVAMNVGIIASVNTPRDVFRKAWISRRLLILVTAGTCTSDALNVSWWEEGCIRSTTWSQKLQAHFLT